MEMVIGILGILKAGGAYVPVDPKLSDERIDHILSDCSAEVVVTNQKKIRQSISVIDLTIQEVFSGESRNLNLIRKAEDLAYCIYTSGTTGHPKGVLVEHHSIVDYVQFDKWKLDVSESLFLSKYHFDLGYTTFYLSLLNGGCLHLIDEEIVLEPYLLVDYLIQNKITLFKMTPSQLATLIDVMYIYSPQKFKYLKHVIVGGEEIRSEDLYKLQEWLPEVELFNHYGPTETTIGVLVSPIDKEVLMRKNSILGRPINHNQIYIMNDDQLSGIGVPGEIYIAGEGVSRGYLNQPELTKKKFVKNPFHKGKMYRSGDLARWLPNGNIEYLGRIDDQIKLHGFRIELAEIENTLRALKNIIDCVVSVRTSEQGDPEGLNAYYVCATPLDSSEIRGQLTQLLPSYMVPQYYKELSAIPVTANGKVDRKSLPEIETASYSVYVAPKTELEVLLATNFEKILEKESIGIDDNFFDLGGHSLRAAHLINLLQPLLEKQIFVRDLFEHPTVRSLANYLETGKMFSYQSIPKAEEKEYYEMPSAQKRMYLLYKLDPESITYNMPRHLTFSKSLNINNLRSTLQKMVERHEILRTTFHLFNDQPVQKIHSHLEIDFEEITEDVTRKLVQPFDLENGPLFRVRVIKKENETWSLFLDMHHIISDGLSIKVFSDELSSLYQGNLLPLPERQYKDYSEWLNHKDYSRQQKYWHTLLKNPVQLNIPTDYPRPKNRSTAGKTIFNSFGKELSHQIKRIAKQRRVSEYMVVLSALMVVLSRYGQQEDIMIGSPVSGRTHKDTELMLGLFANTLVFRGYPEKEKTFATFLDEIKHMCLSNYDYQEYPFENLVDELVTDRDFSRNPLFDVMLIWQNNEKVTQVLNEEIGFEIDNRLETTKFDLSLTVRENQGEYQFAFTYSTDLYQEETIEKIAGHLCTFLGHISPEGETRIEEVSMVDEEEEVYLTKVLNDTKQEYPKGDTIVDLFEKSVQRNEEKTAVIFEGKEITYQELNRKANQLARDLRRQGVKPDNLVAMITTRSVEMLIGILGILKAGGAYVPIDPNFPAERIHYILSDAKPKVILTYGTTIETNTPVIDLKTDEWKQNEDTNLPKVNTPKDLVYCLYTSGTTGNPKGVLIEHQNLVNYCTVDHEFDGNAIACTTNYTFDIFGTEFFWPLVNGKKVIYFFEDFDMSCSDWQFVDMLNTTPTKLRIIIENHSGILQSGQIKNILLIGEELTYTFLTDIKKHTDAKIYNCYGPTEATILVSEFKAVHTPKITIGKPSKNCQIYIMSGNQLNGIGITGELCIAGDGVGRGYLNRPELTNERFVENPFGEGKLYRSGDLARWLPDGNLEYLGRMDDQIKLRGFRIELAEIENTLREIDGVVNSAVTVKFSSSNEPEALNAYYVTSIELSVEEIRSNLKKVLPSYMVPQYYLELDALPITSNGKLDRKALPEIAVTSSNAYCAPETKTQKVLVSAFEDILEKELIGIDDDFFELGGHSLKAAQLTNHLSALTKKEVKVRDIFEYSTVRLLARHLENQKELSNETIPFADKKDYYKMTSAQKRLYLLDQFNPEGIVYNMPGLLEFSEILDIKKLENALCLLVHRHEILRTTFQLQNDQAVQKIHDDLKPEISWHQEGEPLICPFDLENGPLIRVKILENELNHSVIFFDMHHIISDGASLKIFADELTALYQGTQLPQITHQHKDYSEWLNHKDMEVSKKYWHNLLEDPPKSNIITDYPRPKNQSFIGETVKSYLGKEITEKVKSFARATGTTEFMIVLSALMIVLSRYSRQEDIMVGSSISGRTHKETETMLGMFVNTLVFRGKPLKNKKYLKYLTEVKEMCLNNYSHQMYPFERLVEELIEDRDFSRNPFFDVMLVWQNNDQFENESVTVSDNLGNSNVTKFDLSISVIEKAKGYEFKLTFCSEIFSKETAEIMLTHLKEMISNLIAIKNDDQIISEISMITDSEKMVLIDTFNPIINEGYGEDTVIDLFENSVKRNPNRVAIVFENREITYSELNCRANQLARYLSDHGVKKGTFVAMYTQRSIEMAIGILAIIKAGAAYVPIDTEYPDERIQYILSDSQPVAILTYETYIETDVPIIDLSNKSIYLNNNTNNLIVQNSSSDLLNCIYTSGTTGNPKGVLVEHKNLVNFCKIEHPFDYTIFEGEFLVVLGFTTFAFDIFANEFFYPLSKGGKIILASCDEQKDTFQLLKMVDKYGVTFIGSTPSRLKTMLEIDKSEKYLSSLKLIYLGGEILSDALVSSIHDKSTASLFNCYGPTEATVQVTEGQIFNEITIGKPSQNTQIFILENDSLCGIGVPGELCIAGNGLARGYLNQPELTKEKFTENPFGVGRIYHTGDLARWLPNGTIDYLGRIDRQVKLHGYRIELAEIENAMNAFKEVLNCVVTLRKSDESESLNVYYVSKNEIAISEIQKKLKERLPLYMIPQFFMQLETLPITNNGKIDVEALPEISISSTQEYVAPESEIELIISNIFESILNIEKIGMRDNFFELGGDSIKAMRIRAKLRDLGFDLPIQDIMEGLTIEQLIHRIKTFSTEESQELISGGIEKTPIIRMFDSWNLKKPSHFNQAIMLKVDGISEIEIKKALREIVFHHDMLRMTYKNNQILIPEKSNSENFEFESFNLKGSQNLEKEIECITNRVQSSFDLANGPLFKGILFDTAKGKSLMLCAHHLVVDGVSWRIIIEDFKTLTDKEQDSSTRLPLKTTSYKKWSEALLDEMPESEQFSLYWPRVIEKIRNVTNAPDKQHQVPKYGMIQKQVLKDDQLKRLFSSRVAFNTEINDLLLAAFCQAVKKWTDSKYVPVYLEGHGRENISNDIDVSRTVGWFTSVFPVNLYAEDDISDLIISTKEILRSVPLNGLSYGVYYKEDFPTLNIQYGFNYLGDAAENEELFADLSTGEGIDKSNKLLTPISFNGFTKDSNMNFFITFDQNLYSEESVRILGNLFSYSLIEIIDFCSAQNDSINTLSDIGSTDLSEEEIDALNDLFK
jgi:surfactin family lipopeptide synthetase A